MGWPAICTSTQPSVTRNRSHGATEVPRLPMRGFSTPSRSRSIRKAFDIISAVGSRAPSTCWPRPVACRWYSAIIVPMARVIAVPKSA